MHITSRDNSLLKLARSARDGKADDLIFVEGLRLAEEALRSGLRIEALIYSEELSHKQRAEKAIVELSKAARRSASISERLLGTISYTKTPQGIVLLATRPRSDVEYFNAKTVASSLFVVLHQINNPVNVGAILRTAEAAGVSGVITTKDTSDPFSPKSLRGAMGSAFRIPIWRDPEFAGVISWCAARGIATVGTAIGAKLCYTDLVWTNPVALLLGPESTGLGEDEVAQTDFAVTIPMQGDVESLNVAVAAGILLFEAARQRGFKS